MKIVFFKMFFLDKTLAERGNYIGEFRYHLVTLESSSHAKIAVIRKVDDVTQI